MRPELADALHALRNKATIIDLNARYVREHGKLPRNIADAVSDMEEAAKAIAELVRGMEALVG